MAAEARPGRVVGGRYELVEELGSGGFGRVWRARDAALDRDVAVKEMWMPVTAPAERAERLARAGREARNAAALAGHPNIVTVHDVVVEDEAPWIVMQFVEGVSVQSHLAAHGPLPVEQVAVVARALLTALGAAHAAGIVHRDVKPANVLLANDGSVLLTDFGIAVADGDQTLTVSGSFLGSMDYTAPERAEGRDGIPASDLFSLGATLFEAVEGLSPFHRDTRTGTLTALLVQPTPPLERAGRLAPLIEALLRKDPDERPSVAEALQLLDRPAATKPYPTTAMAPAPSPSPSPSGSATPETAAPTPPSEIATPDTATPTLVVASPFAAAHPAPAAPPAEPATVVLPPRPAATPPTVSAAPPTVSAANPWLSQAHPGAPTPNMPFPGQPNPPWPMPLAGPTPSTWKNTAGVVGAVLAVAAIIGVVLLAVHQKHSSDTVATVGQSSSSPSTSSPATSGSAPDHAFTLPPDPAPTSAYVPDPAPAPAVTDLMGTAQVGDCFYDNGSGSTPDLSEASCTGGAYQVVKIFTGTTNLNSCDNVKDSTESVSSSLHDLVLCLSYQSAGGTAYHAHPGDCVYGPNSTGTVWSIQACQTGNFKVLARYPGTADDTKCDSLGSWDESETFTESKSDLSVVLCLDMNYPDAAGHARQNDCLSKSGTATKPVFTQVSSCSQANVVVTGRTSTYDDPNFCGNDGAAWWQPSDYPKLGYTICWRWK